MCEGVRVHTFDQLCVCESVCVCVCTCAPARVRACVSASCIPCPFVICRSANTLPNSASAVLIFFLDSSESAEGVFLCHLPTDLC